MRAPAGMHIHANLQTELLGCGATTAASHSARTRSSHTRLQSTITCRMRRRSGTEWTSRDSREGAGGDWATCLLAPALRICLRKNACSALQCCVVQCCVSHCTTLHVACTIVSHVTAPSHKHPLSHTMPTSTHDRSRLTHSTPSARTV